MLDNALYNAYDAATSAHVVCYCASNCGMIGVICAAIYVAGGGL